LSAEDLKKRTKQKKYNREKLVWGKKEREDAKWSVKPGMQPEEKEEDEQSGVAPTEKKSKEAGFKTETRVTRSD